MDKARFFKEAINANRHLEKEWCLHLFTVTRYVEKLPEEYDIRYLKDKTEVYLRNQWMNTGTKPYEPLFDETDYLEVYKGDLPNVTKDYLGTSTTYGDYLFNARTSVYAFNSQLEYMTGPINIEKVESIIASRLKDNPSDGVKDSKYLYVSDYLKWGQAICDLTGFCDVWVPAASPKSMTTDPEIPALKEKLLKENKDRLHDPVVQSEIQNALIEKDKAWLKNDRSWNFFLKSKQFDTARKRMYLIHGPEAGFSEGTTAELITNTLADGWNLKKLPAMINSLRAGSYFRGSLTALGGESVKFFMRIFQNTMISMKDCGVTYGLPVTITRYNVDTLPNVYRIENFKPVLITKEWAYDNLGKTIEIRSPGYCKASRNDFCEICSGADNAMNPAVFKSEVPGIGSRFMSIMMASAHAKALKTANIDYELFLS